MSEQIGATHEFYADPFLVEHLVPRLDPDGPGFADFGPIIDADYAEDLYYEITRDLGPEGLARLPLARQIVRSVRHLVNFSVAEDYPSLTAWNPDKVTIERDRAGDMGILMQQSQPLPWELDAIITLSTPPFKSVPQNTTYPLRTGNLTLVRYSTLPN